MCSPDSSDTGFLSGGENVSLVGQADGCPMITDLFNYHCPKLQSICSPLVAAFQKMSMPISDDVEKEESDEPYPPGLDQVVKPVTAQKIKFHPMKSYANFSEMDMYIAFAMCRQKLHNDVMQELKLAILDDKVLESGLRSQGIFMDHNEVHFLNHDHPSAYVHLHFILQSVQSKDN